MTFDLTSDEWAVLRAELAGSRASPGSRSHHGTRTLPSILARLEPPKPALGTSTSRHDTRRRGGGHGNEGQSNDARTRPSRCAVPPLAQPERPALITIL